MQFADPLFPAANETRPQQSRSTLNRTARTQFENLPLPSPLLLLLPWPLFFAAAAAARRRRRSRLFSPHRTQLRPRAASKQSKAGTRRAADSRPRRSRTDVRHSLPAAAPALSRCGDHCPSGSVSARLPVRPSSQPRAAPQPRAGSRDSRLATGEHRPSSSIVGCRQVLGLAGCCESANVCRFELQRPRRRRPILSLDSTRLDSTRLASGPFQRQIVSAHTASNAQKPVPCHTTATAKLKQFSFLLPDNSRQLTHVAAVDGALSPPAVAVAAAAAASRDDRAARANPNGLPR